MICEKKGNMYFFHVIISGIKIHQPAEHSPATRVVIHSIFVLGPSALGMGESDNL